MSYGITVADEGKNYWVGFGKVNEEWRWDDGRVVSGTVGQYPWISKEPSSISNSHARIKIEEKTCGIADIEKNSKCNYICQTV